MLVRWHEDAGYKAFNEDIITAYFNDADQRLYDGRIGAGCNSSNGIDNRSTTITSDRS